MPSAYTPTQLSHYLTHISLPAPPSPPRLDLPFLTALHTHQLCTIPYENLSLHYSPDHTVRLDPQHLYRKLVTGGRGRGGYCMEIAVFFNHILRALGFEVYTAGARVRPRVDGVPRGEYLGWVHVVNIVTLPSGAKYMLDVSYGGDGPTMPLPFIENRITRSGIGTQSLRLIHAAIPEQPSQNQRVWIYQYRNADTADWNSCYCFPEFEFTAADFEVMNFYASQSQASFQTHTVLVIKFLRRSGDGDGDGGGGGVEVYGKVMMVDGVVKRNLGGKTEVVRVCGSEEERVGALGEYFGITLTEDEKEGIRGREVELEKGVLGRNSWL